MEEKKNRASRDSMGGGGMGGFSDRPPMGRGERGSQVRAFVSLEQGQHWWWWYGRILGQAAHGPRRARQSGHRTFVFFWIGIQEGGKKNARKLVNNCTSKKKLVTSGPAPCLITFEQFFCLFIFRKVFIR